MEKLVNYLMTVSLVQAVKILFCNLMKKITQNPQIFNVQTILAYQLLIQQPFQVIMALKKEIYGKSLHLWLSQHPSGLVARIWVLSNQCTFKNDQRVSQSCDHHLWASQWASNKQKNQRGSQQEITSHGHVTLHLMTMMIHLMSAFRTDAVSWVWSCDVSLYNHVA